MPLTRPSRGRLLRATGVVLITAVVWGAAACSDEDTVDTIPPPWPSATNRSLDEGPQIPTSTTTATSSTRSTSSTSTGR
jgi:hypothetical protein